MSSPTHTHAPVELLTAVKPLPGAASDNIFTNTHPPWTPGAGVRAIFGGFLIAQSVAAALATGTTAPASSSESVLISVHSLQSVFLRPGNSVVPIEYHVERVADGRAFATRIVRAVQDNIQLFVATIGLHKARQQQGHDAAAASMHRSGEKMPDLGDINPEDLSPNNHAILRQMGYTQAMIDNGPPDPFEWRPVPTDSARCPPQDRPATPSTFKSHSFIRSPPLHKDAPPAAHIAALAFLTDEWFLGTPSLASPELVGAGGGNIKMQASLNHSVLFHDPAARADEWMVMERSMIWADRERVLLRQMLWNRATGKLVLSCWQEGLVRLGPVKL